MVPSASVGGANELTLAAVGDGAQFLVTQATAEISKPLSFLALLQIPTDQALDVILGLIARDSPEHRLTDLGVGAEAAAQEDLVRLDLLAAGGSLAGGR